MLDDDSLHNTLSGKAPEDACLSELRSCSARGTARDGRLDEDEAVHQDEVEGRWACGV